MSREAPFDPAVSRAQIRSLRQLLGDDPRRVLDLGCGDGRIARPLVRAGHRVTALDRDPEALARCRKGVPAAARERLALVEGDFTDERAWASGRFDAVLCLGNTFMLLADVDRAVEFLARAARRLAPRGFVAIDDVPGDLWPEVASGNWQSGTSDDGQMQLLWEASDDVFVLRHGREVVRGDETPAPGEPRYRLWTDGSLRLAALAAGLSPPVRHRPGHLLTMRRSRGRGARALRAVT